MSRKERCPLDQPSSTSALEADTDELCFAVVRSMEEQRVPEHTAEVIERHGFDRFVAYLTGRVVAELEVVAHCRGDGSTASAVFDEFFDESFDQFGKDLPSMLSELSGLPEMFRQWMHDGRRPQISDSDDQELFVLFLLALHFSNTCELASGRSPVTGQPHRRPFLCSEPTRETSPPPEDSPACSASPSEVDESTSGRPAVERRHRRGDVAG